MHNLLNKIQRLPETQRKILAVLTMVAITPLFFYMFAGVFKNNLAQTALPANPAVQAQENQPESEISPVAWIIQSADVLKSNGFGFVKTLLDATGSLADEVADIEQKLLPGFNSFMASIFWFGK